ncbi:MAG: tRNA pseudouridine(55) synthase TruB [Tissierellales bacterium]|nr:tRNA pseudouridine(55) synthase TruB [Tissierellales bacterium]
MDGILNFYKPVGITSHDAVNILRRIMNTKKIGHIGTLDPMACGVLPMLVGNATRISEYLIEHDKEYLVELTLGVRTNTFDKEGKPISSSDKNVSSDEIVNTFNKFVGIIQQTPPMFSSKKVKGKKLYELAREGIEIERDPSTVEIKKIDIIRIIENKKIVFKVKCSKGTYMRSLCDDIGISLGTFGYMSYLQRVKVGNFNIENSLSHEALKKLISQEKSYEFLMPMDEAISEMKKIEVNKNQFSKLRNGNKIHLENIYSADLNNLFRVYSNGLFIGIGRITIEKNQTYLVMKKVLIGDNIGENK